MIYGYGTREYLASGYKAELTGGYSWGEFGERMYLGTGYTIGDFTRIGYLSGGFSLGSYIDLSTGGWSGSAFDSEMRRGGNAERATTSRCVSPTKTACRCCANT